MEAPIIRKRDLKSASKKPKFVNDYTANLTKAVKHLRDNGITTETEVEIEFEQKMENFLTEINEEKKPKSLKRQRSKVSVEDKVIHFEDVDVKPTEEVAKPVAKAMPDDDNALLSSYIESLNQSTLSNGNEKQAKAKRAAW